MTTTIRRPAKEIPLHRATREFRELARQHKYLFGADAKSDLRDRITILITALNTGDYQQAVDIFQTIRDIVVGRIVSEDTERWLDNVRDELLQPPARCIGCDESEQKVGPLAPHQLCQTCWRRVRNIPIGFTIVVVKHNDDRLSDAMFFRFPGELNEELATARVIEEMNEAELELERPADVENGPHAGDVPAVWNRASFDQYYDYVIMPAEFTNDRGD